MGVVANFNDETYLLCVFFDSKVSKLKCIFMICVLYSLRLLSRCSSFSFIVEMRDASYLVVFSIFYLVKTFGGLAVLLDFATHYCVLPTDYFLPPTK